MKFNDFKEYLKFHSLSGSLYEMKRLEWIFIGARWLWVPAVFLLAWLHQPISRTAMWWLGIGLALCNVLACVLNIRIRNAGSQKILGLALLIVDTLTAWGIIFLFAHDFYTSAYAAFVYIIIEAAVRYGLAGSLGAAALFMLGLYGAYTYRQLAHDVRFSNSGYAFWTAVMFIVAVSTGIVVNEWRKQRRRSERYLWEKTLLSERHRIARELHDTVLKTLQGLSLEARALGNRTDATMTSVKETAQYIENVCAHTSREIREVIFDLRSQEKQISIASQIAEQLEKWGKDTGIPVDLTLSGQDITLPGEPSRQIRNIVSEALVNIQRHACASRVRITVKISASDLCVEIDDNGQGILRRADKMESLVAEGKLGIAGMKERVESLGGKFYINGDNTGTKVEFQIPVHQIREGKTQIDE